MTTNTARLIGSAVGGPAVVLAIGLLAFILWRRRRSTINEADTMHVQFETVSISKKFEYSELKAATSNFAEQHKLGAGGFGSVYKGYLKASKTYVAVKRISSDSKQGINEFASEVKTISTLRHRNLVQLLGWCYERKELLLVYEFMPNGSLDLHLFKGKSLLDWATRFSIVKGLASALLYLHEEWDQYIVHRDIKASNIRCKQVFRISSNSFVEQASLWILIKRKKYYKITTIPTFSARIYVALDRTGIQMPALQLFHPRPKIEAGKKPKFVGNIDRMLSLETIRPLPRHLFPYPEEVNLQRLA